MFKNHKAQTEPKIYRSHILSEHLKWHAILGSSIQNQQNYCAQLTREIRNLYILQITRKQTFPVMRIVSLFMESFVP